MLLSIFNDSFHILNDKLRNISTLEHSTCDSAEIMTCLFHGMIDAVNRFASQFYGKAAKTRQGVKRVLSFGQS